MDEMDYLEMKAQRSKDAICEMDEEISKIREEEGWAASQTPKQALDAAIFAAVEQFEEATGCKVESAEYCADAYTYRQVQVRSK